MGCLVIQLIPFRRSPFASRSLVLLLENVLPEAKVAIAGILAGVKFVRRRVLHGIIVVVVSLISL